MYSKGFFADYTIRACKTLSKGAIMKHDVHKPTHESEYRQSTIAFLGGRPERINIIDADDIANLRIALNTCESLEDFLLQI